MVSGGPVGATLALLAARTGRQVTLLEARAHDAGRRDDPRVLALSHASQQALLAAGGWPDSLAATAIDPGWWLHPLGPLTKNLPIAAILWTLWRASPASPARPNAPSPTRQPS